ncbi:hypothetical protein ES703_111503 [subsurface metagenome]
MNGMKGRNCYARFWSLPSFEKLLNFIEVKASFLRPVTLPSSQREPFKMSSVAGYLTRLMPCLLSYRPATGFFFAGLIVGSGRYTLCISSHRKQPFTGHCYFLFRSHCTEWPISIFGVVNPGPTASRPLLFCCSTSQHRVVGLVAYGLPPSRAAKPATTLFCSLHSLQGGWARLQVSPRRVRLRANRFFAARPAGD